MKALSVFLLGALSFARGAESVAPPVIPAETVPGVVELPPFLVDEKEKKSLWLHGSMPGFEVLSRTEANPTQTFMEGIYRAHRMLDAVLPREMQGKLSTPSVYVLYGEDMKQAVPPEILGSMTHLNVLPNFELSDVDEMAVVALVRSYGRSSAVPMQLTQNAVGLLLSYRLPQPPRWFVSGFLDMFDGIRFGERDIEIAPLTWKDDALSEVIEHDPQYPRQMLPLAELFHRFRTAASTRDDQFLRVWRSEAALFIRWGIDPKGLGNPSALWRFVDASSEGAVDETFFQQCFGLNYADALDRLSDYLPVAVKEHFRIQQERAERLPPMQIRTATDAEISRIKGEWERLEVNYVKLKYPPVAQKYRDEAIQTVENAYKRGERDPGFQAVMGLDSVDAGDADKAIPFLEAAATGGVTRPRVYYELARLKYAAALAKLPTKSDPLGLEEAAVILGALEECRRYQPQLEDGYILMGNVLVQRRVPASRLEMDTLEAGTRLFPMDMVLLSQVVVLATRQGLNDEALTAVERGIPNAPQGPVQERLKAWERRLKATATK